MRYRMRLAEAGQPQNPHNGLLLNLHPFLCPRTVSGIVGVIVFILTVGSCTRDLEASCGDYLLHSTTRLRPQDFGGSSSPSIPLRHCKNGICKSGPMSPPMQKSNESEIRLRPSCFRVEESIQTSPMRIWSTSGIFLEPSMPYLEVAVPPPKIAIVS